MAYAKSISSADHCNDVDAHLETALQDCTLDELCDMRAMVLRSSDSRSAMNEVATRIPEVAHWARFRGGADGDVDAMVFMLLGALALAIAWLQHRSQPAPAHRIQQALAAINDGHPYLLAIPRSGPCFCGGARQFRHCHGRPPVAA